MHFRTISGQNVQATIENYSRLTHKDTCTKVGFITSKTSVAVRTTSQKDQSSYISSQINQLGRLRALFQPESHSFPCCVSPPSFPTKGKHEEGNTLENPLNVVTSLQLVTSYYLGSAKQPRQRVP